MEGADEGPRKGSMGHGACDHVSRSLNLPMATSNSNLLGREVAKMLVEVAIPPSRLRGMGVAVGKLAPAGGDDDKLKGRPRATTAAGVGGISGSSSGSSSGGKSLPARVAAAPKATVYSAQKLTAKYAGWRAATLQPSLPDSEAKLSRAPRTLAEAFRAGEPCKEASPARDYVLAAGTTDTSAVEHAAIDGHEEQPAATEDFDARPQKAARVSNMSSSAAATVVPHGDSRVECAPGSYDPSARSVGATEPGAHCRGACTAEQLLGAVSAMKDTLRVNYAATMLPSVLPPAAPAVAPAVMPAITSTASAASAGCASADEAVVGQLSGILLAMCEEVIRAGAVPHPSVTASSPTTSPSDQLAALPSRYNPTGVGTSCSTDLVLAFPGHALPQTIEERAIPLPLSASDGSTRARTAGVCGAQELIQHAKDLGLASFEYAAQHGPASGFVVPRIIAWLEACDAISAAVRAMIEDEL